MADALILKQSPGLRTLCIPGDLISTFLHHAKVNSDQSIETLGTLGGVLCSNNQFRVSHLLIPKQTGFSDRCAMDADATDVWEIHEKENLLFLGWIHTHPAYSVFLSSVDLHNQFEYQRMLPEVSAILLISRILHLIICSYSHHRVIRANVSGTDGLKMHLETPSTKFQHCGHV